MARRKKADKVCATIDLWSRRQMRSYFDSTGHFIVDWALKSVILGCTRYRGSHTADHGCHLWSQWQDLSHCDKQRCQHAQSIFTPWFRDHMTDSTHESSSDDDDDEDDDVTTAVSDDSLFEYVNDHITCFANTLQLVINDGLQQAGMGNKVLAKASAVVSREKTYSCHWEAREPQTPTNC